MNISNHFWKSCQVHQIHMYKTNNLRWRILITLSTFLFIVCSTHSCIVKQRSRLTTSHWHWPWHQTLFQIIDNSAISLSIARNSTGFVRICELVLSLKYFDLTYISSINNSSRNFTPYYWSQDLISRYLSHLRWSLSNINSFKCQPMITKSLPLMIANSLVDLAWCNILWNLFLFWNIELSHRITERMKDTWFSEFSTMIKFSKQSLGHTLFKVIIFNHFSRVVVMGFNDRSYLVKSFLKSLELFSASSGFVRMLLQRHLPEHLHCFLHRRNRCNIHESKHLKNSL